MKIRARVERSGFAGRATVDWVDAHGAVVATDTYDIVDGSFEATAATDAPADIAGAAVYVQDADNEIDGIGGVTRAVSEGGP